ncbi:hypothetical protein AMJ85_05305 [candidate division BRC1 bacterium SM23_51]|nr:MAG: hypothetical protein AMJ85_05305 [candidate division BRC1 bacterium SM23_51]
MPETSTLQFDGRLTNVAIEYTNPEYIADLVLPVIPTTRKNGTFKQFTKDERFTVPDTLVGPKSDPNEIDWSVDDVTFACKDHALEEFVSNEDIDNAESPIQPLAKGTERVMDAVMMRKEKRIADAIFLTTNYGASNQVDIEGGWATLSDDALTDIITGIDACFVPPNVMVMGLPTWRKLQRNATILAAVKGTLKEQTIKTPGGLARPTVNVQELAEYLGLDAVLIGRAKINTAKKGQTATYAPIWDGTTATKGGAALLRVKQGAVIGDVVWGAQFTWKKAQTFTYDTKKGAYGGKYVRVVETTVEKVIATDVGYLFKDVLAT